MRKTSEIIKKKYKKKENKIWEDKGIWWYQWNYGQINMKEIVGYIEEWNFRVMIETKSNKLPLLFKIYKKVHRF